MSSSLVTVTRRLYFDAGHRIPDHDSVCRSVHGHRYTLEVSLCGPVHDRAGAANNGMVIDFADIKKIAQTHIVSLWDHAFLVYAHDQPLCDFLQSMPGTRNVVLDCIPTAENLARYIFDTLVGPYREAFGEALVLRRVVLYETPNCFAEVEAAH